MVANLSSARPHRPSEDDTALAQLTVERHIEQARLAFQTLSAQWEQIANSPAEIAAAPGHRLVSQRQSLQEMLAALGGLLLEWSLQGGECTLSTKAHPAEVSSEAHVAEPSLEAVEPLPPTPQPQPPALAAESPPTPSPSPTPRTYTHATKKTPPAEITAQKRRALETAFNTRNFNDASDASASPHLAVHDIQTSLLQRIEQLDAITSESAFSAAFSSLQSLTSEDNQAAWRFLPNAEQVTLIQCLTAYLRYLQSEVSQDLRPLHARGDNAIDSLIKRLHGYTASTRCGHVYGLRLSQRPMQGSWRADTLSCIKNLRNVWSISTSPAEASSFNPEVALDTLRELIANPDLSDATLCSHVNSMLRGGMIAKDPRLCDLLTEHVARLTGSSLSNLRAAIRKHIRALDDEAAHDAADLSASSLVSTTLRASMQGKRVTLIGGEHLGHAPERLSALFPDATINWTPTTIHGGTALSTNLINAINYRGVDIVLVISRFISHKIYDRIQKAAEHACPPVSVGIVTYGYGLRQLIDALSRALSL